MYVDKRPLDRCACPDVSIENRTKLTNTRIKSALRVRPRCARLPYLDPMDQSHPLDRTLKARGASGAPTI